MSGVDWSALLDAIDAEDPPALEVAERLADARDLDAVEAQNRVFDAIDSGDLVEDGDGFGGVRFDAEDPAVSGETDEESPEEAGSPAPNPTPHADDSVDKYRRVYLDAADRAGREPWEYVEEDALREALDTIGFADLLDSGDLFHVRDWRVADVSDDGEEPRRRWYYPSGNEPRAEEFRRFDKLLTEAAPDGYTPHYFRVAKAGKDPATQYGSWKTEDARLSVEEAVAWMQEGGNVGIAGTPDDALINGDIDDDEATTPADVPTSLRAISRSRTGWHTWYFDEDGDVPNIPTDEYGEIRTDWQYVVAPGSFVASTAEEIPDGADDPGYYTVEDEEPVARIGYDDLPEVFREAAEAAEEAEDDGDDAEADTFDPDDAPDADDRSAVFDVEAADLVSESDASRRFGSIFHNSKTGANMSVSGDKLHCWRHDVAHGGLQALATLSDEITEGCRELGAAHKNSGAGRNRLKGDWALVWAGWHEAKDRGAIPDDDPIPYRALRGVAVRDGLVEEEDLVERETDDGSYTALPDADAYNAALEHIDEEYGLNPGREPVDRGRDTDDSGDTFDDDPREAEVVLDARRAWDAARRVIPDDLDAELQLDTTTDGEAWVAHGVTVDVVRAVAVAAFDHAAEDTLDAEAYDRAYRHAREAYGAPLPEYVTAADAADRYDVVLGAVRALDFFDLDADALTAAVAEADEGGDVSHYIDPSPVDGWRDSDSGESVLVFDSGTVYDADTEETIDGLRLVALDAGLIDSPTEDLVGDRFQRAYRLARDEYGAPLPRWAIGTPEVEPVLPPAEDLVDVVPDTDDELQDAWDDVTELYRQLARGDGDGDVSVLRALPGLGKTTSAIKSAAEVPTSYLAPRKELQKDAAAKADNWGASWEYLPVFGGGDISDVAVEAAVEAVREEGMGLLRNRRALLDAVDEPLYPEDDSDDTDSDDLDRATCSCAEADHGEGWALAVHTARALDYRPGLIHTRAEELFGEPLPCQDGQRCDYSAGWDRIADGDRPLDLVIGSYGHAHVESARTHYSLDSRGHTDRSERAVVLDEFVGDAFTEEFGEEFVDISVWLASSLRDDVADRQDLFSADLWGDDWVRAWLRGDGAEDGDAAAAHDAALQLAGVAEAVDTAADLLDAHAGFVDTHGLAEPLEDLRDGAADLDADEADRIAAALRAPLGDLRDAGGGLNAMRSDADELRHDTEDGPAADTVSRVLSDVAEPLEAYDGADVLDALPACVGGDLRAFVEDAVAAAHHGHDGAAGVLRSVATALEGGDAGCRELAIHADDGYAHRLAHRLLYGVVAPGGGDGVAELIETDAFDYSGEGFDGTRLKHVRVDAGGGTDTILVDRNHEGATVLSPPSRTAGNGEECPVVGLDATARRRLWGLMLGADVGVEDIHDSMADRARFLRDGLGLQVVRTAQKRRFYEGDPAGKDLDGDVALIEEINDEYAGVYAGDRDEEAATVGSPAVITTKGVRRVLEADDRLDDKVAGWDNYGNITGDNDLGDHRLAAVLGCQHYGDAPVEKVAALAGEEVTRSGHGLRLSYDSAVANTYLKHMTEDQTMQAILRFTRGDSGAVVFARTAALREDLPVVGEGQVVRSWSDTAATVARAWKAQRGERFTVADVADSVDVSRRQVRRVLDEFASAGYLEKHNTGAGVANEFTPGADPSAGEVDLPGVDMNPDTSRKGTIYTGNVRVWSLEDGDRRPPRPTRSTLPAPEAEDGVAPPG